MMMMMMSRVHPFVVFLGSPARILAGFFRGETHPCWRWPTTRSMEQQQREREREFWWHGTLFFIFIWPLNQQRGKSLHKTHISMSKVSRPSPRP